MARTSIDIDTGGTFTDAFVVRDGEPHTMKVLTTPHDLALCFRQVIEKAAEELGVTVRELLRETGTVRYATTVGTNTIIQRTGPRLGLIAGAGAGERLYAADGRADAVFELFLAPDMVAGVEEPEDGDAVGAAMRELLEGSARGLVCALPGAAGEHHVRERFEEQYPKHCLDAVPLLLSGEVARDDDDFRRTATALFNAYVHPDVAGYLYRAEDFLRDHGFRRPLLIVHNDGGCARVAKTVAARTYNSGPAAGLMGTREIAALYGLEDLVAFDMGGTSLDVAILAGREVPLREHGSVEGVEVSFALPDLLALGAGGGSIVRRDEDGELRVGPQSAGARPGPACFGFGGEAPTVTDADVVLGVLDPDHFLGGTMRLDAERARRAFATVGEDPVAVAAEALRVMESDMGGRVAAELGRRGVDPAGATMLAYGGAGPMHAAGIAARAGVRRILTVPFAAVFSAFGASSADVLHTYRGDDAEGLRRRALRDMRGEGFGPAEVELVESGSNGSTTVTATAALEHFRFATRSTDAAAPEPLATRTVHWPQGGAMDTAVFDAAALHGGAEVGGPAIVEASDTTIVVPTGWGFRVDEHGNGRLEASA